MNPPNNIQNGFFTPVSPFFSKVRKLTVFSRNPHTPIIPQSVRLRRSADGAFMPKNRLSRHFSAARADHSARNVPETKKIICPAHAAHVGHTIGLTPSTACELLPPPAGGPPPSRREVWGIRRSRAPALPSIAYWGFAVAPMTLRAPSRNVVIITIQISGCGKYKKRARNARPYGLKASYTTPGAGSQPCSFQRGLWGS